MLRYVLIFSIAGLLFSCSKDSEKADRSSIDPKPAVRANQNIRQSFKVTLSEGSTDQLRTSERFLWISKQALEKEFLLQTAIIDQVPVAMGSGLKSRVVAFRKRGEKLFLMEATQGHTVSSELPQNLLLAEFPILETTDTHFRFDFNAGMTRVLTFGDWQASDDTGKGLPGSEASLATIAVQTSFIENAVFSVENFLEVRQVVLVKKSFTKQDDSDDKRSDIKDFLQQAELRFYLHPYNPDPTYQAFPTPGFDRMGFFEVAPLAKEKGGTHVYATRFHPKKPIVFAISANTPDEYKQAVIDGILYWNKTFGAEVVKVVQAPAGVTAPHPSYNIVQWVNWDLAGFAYADAQMDPRSGEILHAQVFLTSAFAFGGKARMREILRNLEGGEKARPGASSQRVGLTGGAIRLGLGGFSSSQLCKYDSQAKLQATLKELSAQNLTEAQILQAAQDYIREVTAHEIGHTLGLRHNFAGNLVANYRLTDRPQILQNYLHDVEKIKPVITSSSVMEYQAYVESLVSGRQIALGSALLPYDLRAIEALYLDKKFYRQEVPVYCTDSHHQAGNFVDCQQFDYGSSFVEFAKWKYHEVLAGVAKETLEKFIRSKSPAAGEEAVPVEEVQLKAVDKVLESALEGRLPFVRSLTDQGDVLKVHRSFPASTNWHNAEIESAQTQYIQSEVERLGGLSEVLKPLPTNWTDVTTAEFIQILQAHRKGIGYDGAAYEFSDWEVDSLIKYVPSYFRKIQHAVQSEDIQLLALADSGEVLKEAKLRDTVLAVDLGLFSYQRAKEVMFATGPSSIVSEIEFFDEESKTVRKETLVLPQMVYDFGLRSAAMAPLKLDRVMHPQYAYAEKERLKQDLQDFTKKHVPKWLMSIKAESLPKTVLRWTSEMKKIQAAIEE